LSNFKVSLKAFIFCIALVLILVGSFFLLKPVFSESAFWWKLLEPSTSRLFGDKLNCKNVSWCGKAKLCVQECKTNKGFYSVEKISFNLLKRRVSIDNWFVYELPDNFQERKSFFRIPFAIKEIILRKGNLSFIESPVSFIPQISLTRRHYWGQSWKIKGSAKELLNKKDSPAIFLDGFIGDSSDLKLSLVDFPLKSPSKCLLPASKSSSTATKHKQTLQWDTIINGEVQVQNTSFKSAPVYLSSSNLVLSNSFINTKVLPVNKLSFDLKLDKDMNEVLGVKSLKLINKEFSLFSGVAAKKHKKIQSFSSDYSERPVLILPFAKASAFEPYISLIPSLQKFSLSKLQGRLATELKFDLIQNSLLEVLLDLDSVSCQLGTDSSKSRIPSGVYSGEILYKDKEIQKMKASLSKVSLSDWSKVLKNQDIRIDHGTLDAEIDYEKGKPSNKGVFKFNNIALSLPQVNFKTFKGKGDLILKGDLLKGDIVSVVGVEKQSIKTVVDLTLKKEFSEELKKETKEQEFLEKGEIHFVSSYLPLKEAIYKNKAISSKPIKILSGGLKDVFVKFSFQDGNWKLQKAHFDFANLKGSFPQLLALPLTFENGSISSKDGKLLVLEDVGVRASGDEYLNFNGKVSGSGKDFQANDLKVKGSLQIEHLLPILEFSSRSNKDMFANIQKPKGKINLDLKLKDDKLENAKLNFHEVSFSSEEHDFPLLEGSLSYSYLKPKLKDLKKISTRVDPILKA
ncbi:MAG TPA: hypothetical protein V6C96_00590, partial [Vampirovibrionales bacterium]